MLAAIAAKEAKVAPSQKLPQGQLRKAQLSKAGSANNARIAGKAGGAGNGDSEPKPNPKAKVRPDL